MSTNLACPLAREPYVPSQMQINIRSMSVDLVDVFRTLKMLWTQVQILQAQVDNLTAVAETAKVVQPTGDASVTNTPAGPNKRSRE